MNELIEELKLNEVRVSQRSTLSFLKFIPGQTLPSKFLPLRLISWLLGSSACAKYFLVCHEVLISLLLYL